jgi:hypothetical protein
MKPIPDFLPTLLSIFFLPKFLLHYYQSGSYDKQLIRLSKNDIMLSYGYYYFFLLNLNLSRPKAIIISNDHTYQHRILLNIANAMQIPIFYFQHASVTDRFPGLNFTLSFLEGEHARTIYVRNGSDIKNIRLVGMPKFDKYFHQINQRSILRSIGIASNLLDDIHKVRQVIMIIRKFHSDLTIVYRPHPSIFSRKFKHIKRYIMKEIYSIPAIQISDPLQENSFQYLSRIDLNISNQSGIHLEAVLLNVLTINFPFFSYNKEDPYGFVKNKLVDDVRNEKELLNLIAAYINNKPCIRHKAKKYVFTVNTPYDGKSTDLAIKYLHESLNNN